MSYIALSTPNPSSQTQIGYSMNLSATTAVTSSANVAAYTTTTNSAIPIGVWIIVGSCLLAGSSNANVLIGGSCLIQVSGGGATLSTSGFSSPSQTYSYVYLTPSACFYSNGTLNINVQLEVTSNSSTTASNVASLKIIKIA